MATVAVVKLWWQFFESTTTMEINLDLEVQLEPGQLEAVTIDFITCHRRLLVLLTIILAQITQVFHQVLSISPCIPHHTSILTGHAWVLELLTGHPEHIKINFGVPLKIFSVLTHILKENGVLDSWNVTVNEQLGIFLYTCVTGLSSCLVAERFQRSMDTITK